MRHWVLLQLHASDAHTSGTWWTLSHLARKLQVLDCWQGLLYVLSQDGQLSHIRCSMPQHGVLLEVAGHVAYDLQSRK